MLGIFNRQWFLVVGLVLSGVFAYSFVFIAWAQSVTVSGTVIENDRITAFTSEPQLNLAVGGSVVATTTAASDGTFIFPSVASSGAGEPFTIYLTDTTESGVLVVRDDGSGAVENADVFINHVTVDHRDVGPITNSDLAGFDSTDDSAVPLTLIGDTLNISTGHTLLVVAGSTFAPSDAVTTPQLHLQGTYEAGNTDLTITDGGTPFTLESGADFVADTSRVIYTASVNTEMAAVVYYDLALEPVSGSPSFTFAAGSLLPDISDLVMHLDASTINGLSNNDPIDTWTDISGSGNDVTQGTATQQPLYTTNISNGLPAVRFDGGQWLRNDVTYNQPGQMFVVYRQDNATSQTNNEVLFDGRAGEAAGNIIFMELWESGSTWRMFTSDSFSFLDPGAAADDFGIINALYNTSSSVVSFNGTQLDTGDVGSGQLRGLTLGADRNDGRPFNGYIAEVLYFDRALTSSEEEEIEDYLEAKWLGGVGGGSAVIDNDLTIGTGGGDASLDLFNSGTALSVAGSLTIESGQSLSAASSSALQVGGDLTNSGTFVANDGLVELTGSNQTIGGDTTFYDLSKSVSSSDTLMFAANSTTVVEGTWSKQGTSGASLSLRSSNPGTQWNIDPQGTRNLDHLDVQDSNNLNATEVDATGPNFINSGNNTNWTFSGGSISGTVTASDQATPSTAGSEVRLAVDGELVATTTANATDGSFTLAGLDSITAGTPITIYLDGQSETGATLTRHPGSPEVTDVVLASGLLLVAPGDGGAVSNTQAGHFTDADDSAVPLSISGGALTVTSGLTLFVADGATYEPQGDTTSPAIQVAGTVLGGSGTLTLTNSDTPFFIGSSGTFDPETSTVSYTGTANTSIFPTTYHNLETSPASGNPTYVFREGAVLPIQSNLVLHLDATTITGLSDGDPVSQWDDISGNDNHAETWSAVPNPIYRTDRLNGQPVLEYTASEGLLVPDDPSLSTGDVFTIFAVVDLRATTTGDDNIRTIVSKENDFNDRNYWLVHWDGEWRGRVSDSGTARTVASDNQSQTEPVFISYQANGTDLRMWVNNELQSTITSYGSIDNQNSPLGIGRQADNQRSWDGDLAEILIFDTDLTATQREAVEDYLNLKWFGLGSEGSVEVEVTGDLRLRDGGGQATLDLFAEDDELSVIGDIEIEADQTLSAASSTPLTVGGSWSNAGSFDANQGTVLFTGTNQSIAGNTVFYNFEKTSSTTDTFTFTAGSGTAVINAWTMQGAENEPLLLRSSAPGTQWHINPQGVRDLAWLDVEDSLNVNSGAIDALDEGFVDSGNNVNWLFEIFTDYFTQRGTATLTGSSTTLLPGTDYAVPENSNTAFVRITNTSMTGAGATSDGGAQTPENVTVAITDASDLQSGITLERFGDDRDTLVDWEIIEYRGVSGGDNEMIIHAQEVATFSGTDATAQGDTISGVSDDDSVVVFITGYRNPASSTDTYNSALATADWDAGAGRPVFTREASSVSGVEVSYAVVEFTGSNWKIQRIEHQYTDGGEVETSSIDAVNSLSRTFMETQKRLGSSQTAVNEYGHEVWLSSVGAVSFQIDDDVSDASEHTSVVWVIENTQTGDGAMQVYRSNGTLADAGIVQPQVLDVNIGDTVLPSASSLFVNARSTGINLNFPRPIIGARLINDSEYRVWNSDGGGTQTFRTEVIEWPTAQTTFAQNTYRFYVDDDTLTPSDPWPPGAQDLGENMSITDNDEPLGLGEQVRVRMSLRVSEATLPPETQQFKLQYGERSTICENVNFWNDLGDPGSGADWRGGASSVTSGTPLSSDPPDSGDLLLSASDRAGTYQEQNPTPENPYAVQVGESLEFDWHIEHNGAAPETDYCFRLVVSDGTTLDDYEVYPTVRTAAFRPQVLSWRWYDDINTLTPSDPLAGEQVTPTEIANQDTLSLRVALGELDGAIGENVKFAIEYSEYSDFQDGGTLLTSISDCTENSLWCYADGTGTDNDLIDEAVLSVTDTCSGGSGQGCGTYNEVATSSSSFTHEPYATTEYEFTLRQAGARANAVYHFRLYDVTNDRPVVASSSNPTVSVEGAQLVFTVSGISENTTVAGLETDISTTPDTVDFGSLPLNESRVAAQQLTIDTNATDGYQILLFADQQLTSSHGEIIAPVTGTNANPSGWETGCDTQVETGCFGYHTTDSTLFGGSTRFSAFDTYAALSTSPEEVMYSAVPSTDTEHIVYQIEIGPLQPAGNYNTDIGFLAVPRF